jgi:hypothetical protein
MFCQLAHLFVIATCVPYHCETQITSSKCFYLYKTLVYNKKD